MSQRQKFVLFGLLAIAIAFGFFQEYLKININYLIETGQRVPGFFLMPVEMKKAWIEYYKSKTVQDFYHKPDTLPWLYHLSLNQLNLLKWAMALAFIIIYWWFNTQLVKCIAPNRIPIIWLTRLYLLFFTLAVAIFAIGKLTGLSDNAYLISREILGGLQSLVPLMIFAPIIWLQRQQALASNKNNISHDSTV